MEEATPATQLPKIDLGENGGILARRFIEECIEWARREIDSWRFVEQAHRSGGAEQLIQQLPQELNNAASSLQQAQRESSTNERNRLISRASSQIHKAYSEGKKLPHSTSIHGQFIHSLVADSPTVALYAAAYLLGDIQSGFDLRSPDAVRGAVKAVLFQLRTFPEGLESRAQAATDASRTFARGLTHC